MTAHTSSVVFQYNKLTHNNFHVFDMIIGITLIGIITVVFINLHLLSEVLGWIWYLSHVNVTTLKHMTDETRSCHMAHFVETRDTNRFSSTALYIPVTSQCWLSRPYKYHISSSSYYRRKTFQLKKKKWIRQRCFLWIPSFQRLTFIHYSFLKVMMCNSLQL